ncbi:zinc-finger [Saccharopolyspora shandongensis]|uniref:Zinc-finger n=1 Tax=Saccharopolyspora shandongensis TaxID=418495 RepID=A0A1H3MQT4_9PSEU|nr:zinc-finger [Saccharopolyspora shandongensis]
MIRSDHHWHPAESRRHAIPGMLPPGEKHEGGETIKTLCKRSVRAAQRTESTRQWPVCDECMQAAKELSGVVFTGGTVAVRFAAGVVSDSKRQSHTATVPEGGEVPASWLTFCGLEIPAHQAEVSQRPTGMPCVCCLFECRAHTRCSDPGTCDDSMQQTAQSREGE